MGFLDKLLGRKRTRRVRDDSTTAEGRSSGHKTVVNAEYPLPPLPGPLPQPGGANPHAWPLPQPGGSASPLPPAPAPAPHVPHAPPAPALRPSDAEKTMIGGQAATSTSVIGVLVAVQGPDSGKVFALSRKEETLLGRGAGADVKLSCQSISRPHAKILFDGEDLILVSMKDENLASINGEPIEGAELSDGCLIGLGTDTLLRFRKIEGP